MLQRKDRKGNTKQCRKWYIELRDHLGTVRRYSAFTDKAQSGLLGRQIERLVNYKVAGEQPDVQLSHWLEQIPERLRNRFVKIGLVDSKRAAAGRPLKEHVEDFKQSLAAKGDTDKHVGQTESVLNRMFDACKFRTWSEISASRLQKYLAGLRNRGSGMSARTFN